MSATNRYINWTSVGFTPSGGTLTTITGVTRVKIDESGSPEAFAGDGDQYATTVAVPMRAVTAEVDTGDAAALATVAVGTVGTLVATLNDALNGSATGGGAKLHTLVNAVLVDKGKDGSHGKYAAKTLKFVSFSSDGTTNPLTVSSV